VAGALAFAGDPPCIPTNAQKPFCASKASSRNCDRQQKPDRDFSVLPYGLPGLPRIISTPTEKPMHIDQADPSPFGRRQRRRRHPGVSNVVEISVRGRYQTNGPHESFLNSARARRWVKTGFRLWNIPAFAPEPPCQQPKPTLTVIGPGPDDHSRRVSMVRGVADTSSSGSSRTLLPLPYWSNPSTPCTLMAVRLAAFDLGSGS